MCNILIWPRSRASKRCTRTRSVHRCSCRSMHPPSYNRRLCMCGCAVRDHLKRGEVASDTQQAHRFVSYLSDGFISFPPENIHTPNDAPAAIACINVEPLGAMGAVLCLCGAVGGLMPGRRRAGRETWSNYFNFIILCALERRINCTFSCDRAGIF